MGAALGRTAVAAAGVGAASGSTKTKLNAADWNMYPHGTAGVSWFDPDGEKGPTAPVVLDRYGAYMTPTDEDVLDNLYFPGAYAAIHAGSGDFSSMTPDEHHAYGRVAEDLRRKGMPALRRRYAKGVKEGRFPQGSFTDKEIDRLMRGIPLRGGGGHATFRDKAPVLIGLLVVAVLGIGVTLWATQREGTAAHTAGMVMGIGGGVGFAAYLAAMWFTDGKLGIAIDS